jgi:hypothetical protein
MRSDAGEIPLLAPDPEHQRDQDGHGGDNQEYAGVRPGVLVAEEKTQDAHRVKRQRVYRVRGLT